VLGLSIGKFASQPSQHDWLGLSIGLAASPTVGTYRRFFVAGLPPPDELAFGQPPSDFIADLTGQFLQINERARRR
jgi:hypothetical protein